MDVFDNLPPAVTLVLGMLLLVWLVLLLLVPFMIESIRGWSRRSYHELEEINRKLDTLTSLLADRGDGVRTEPRIEPHAATEPGERARRHRPDRVRKEPTI